MSESAHTFTPSGKLEIYIGPMCSSKTTRLHSRLERYKVNNARVIKIRSTTDTRSKLSHSRGEPPLFDELRVSKLMDNNEPALIRCDEDWKIFKDKDVIGIDEAQFFKEDLIPFVRHLVDNMHKDVIIVGLDGSYKREKFGHILDLIPLADKVEKLSAVCGFCFNDTDASFTVRTVKSSDTILIGGTELYTPACRACWLSNSTGL